MGSVHASRRLFWVSHATRIQRASGAVRKRRAPSVEPGGEEQKGRARLCFWWGEARALSPAPPPASNGRPSPTALPPTRPREMADEPQNGSRARSQAGDDRNKKGALDPLPPARPCRPELPFGGCQGPALLGTGAPSRPHGHTSAFPRRPIRCPSGPQSTRGPFVRVLPLLFQITPLQEALT